MTQHAAKTKLIIEYCFIVIGAALVGLSYNLFLLPAKLAAGGVSGISTIMYDLYQFNPAYVQWLINLPLFILGIALLGKDFSLKTLVGTFFVPFTIWLSADIPFKVDNPLLAAIYGGILLGVGLGIVYRGKGSTGGTATIAQLLRKFTGLSSGYSQFIVDGLVVISSAIVFNLELALYAMISIFVTSKVIDFVQLHSSSSKLVLIITDREEQIQSLIKDEIDRGFTKIHSFGGYSNKEKTLILCVMEQQEAIYFKKALQDHQSSSFVVFLNASEILGRGFSLAKFYDGGPHS
ncbi:YitT family protein [Bacillus xiapuensis]|uniref:YitT family protein n=1 Tax=Bacillus xiapuensis TaxID=2014075 RepID=UPI000C24BDCE|nr:YitT family protein [Bacillus xiapuensis]